MGEPIQPIATDRQATRDLARKVLESVRNDERMPLPLTAMSMSDTSWMPVFDKADVEDLVMQLAQEVCALQGERDAMRRARDTLAEIAECATHVIDNAMCDKCRALIENVPVEHVDALRKAGR